MTPSELMGSLWFQVINLILAALMYTLMGRVFLSFFFKPDSDKVIWRVFCQVTDPVLGVVRIITPLIVAERFIPWLAIAWTLVFRLLLFILIVVLAGK